MGYRRSGKNSPGGSQSRQGFPPGLRSNSETLLILRAAAMYVNERTLTGSKKFPFALPPYCAQPRYFCTRLPMPSPASSRPSTMYTQALSGSESLERVGRYE